MCPQSSAQNYTHNKFLNEDSIKMEQLACLLHRAHDTGGMVANTVLVEVESLCA